MLDSGNGDRSTKGRRNISLTKLSCFPRQSFQCELTQQLESPCYSSSAPLTYIVGNWRTTQLTGPSCSTTGPPTQMVLLSLWSLEPLIYDCRQASYRPRTEQNPKGCDQSVQDHAGVPRRVYSRVGLPWPAHRDEGKHDPNPCQSIHNHSQMANMPPSVQPLRKPDPPKAMEGLPKQDVRSMNPMQAPTRFQVGGGGSPTTSEG